MRCIIYLSFGWAVLTVIFGKSTPAPQEGPCVGMDCMHGVLMHGDGEPGQDHKGEDQYLRFKSDLETERPQAGPQDAEQEFHGVFMHQDTETGEQHVENNGGQMLPAVKSQATPQDLNDVLHEGMHGEEGVNKHDRKDPDENKKKLPMDAEQMMHGVLMHGDAEHGTHEPDPQEESDIQRGPENANDYLHGVLMHGDAAPGSAHAHEEETANTDGADTSSSGPDMDKLHGVLMHGDSEIGIDHSEEDAHLSGESFSDFAEILNMDMDREILETFDIYAILEQDKQEYAEWLKKTQHEKDATGTTFASISDSIYNGVELMKEKYLEKSADDTEPVRPEDDKPFTAEDAWESMDSSSEPHEHEDMKHDIELVGSTDPINMRHKIHNEMQKSKSRSSTSRNGL